MNKLLNNQLLTSLSELYIAHIKTDEISDLTDCTINVHVGNDYGFEEQAFVIHALSTGVDKIIADNSDITIYDIYGSQIYSGNKKDFNKNKLIPGIYIEKSNDNLLTHKFVVR